MVRIAVNGALGRMGRMIADTIAHSDGAEPAAYIDIPQHPGIGTEYEGIVATADKNSIAGSDAVIDFSLPGSTVEMLDYCLKYKVPIVIGTTGLTGEQIEKVKKVSQKIPVVYSSNMSVGVNLFFRILKEASGILNGYDIKISEAHHVHKKDAPSGTAKTIVDIVNTAGNNIKYQDVAVTREGEIIGDHSVVFDGLLDTFEIRHHARTRAIFADGAVRAAVWLAGRAAGLYDMQEVLFR